MRFAASAICFQGGRYRVGEKEPPPAVSFFADRKYFVARAWSNNELKRFSPWFEGDAVNVSAWLDEDKQGRRYRDYFSGARSYAITNHQSAGQIDPALDSLTLDLEAPLPVNLHQRFDVVFNHTTLEHVFDFQLALKNMCDMSRDVVILVVPFLQQQHQQPTFGDFWRFTPSAMERLLAQHEFSVVHNITNNELFASVYVLTVATRYPERWKGRFEQLRPPASRASRLKRALTYGFEMQVGSFAIPNLGYLTGTFLRKVGLKVGQMAGEVRTSEVGAPEHN